MAGDLFYRKCQDSLKPQSRALHYSFGERILQ